MFCMLVLIKMPTLAWAKHLIVPHIYYSKNLELWFCWKDFISHTGIEVFDPCIWQGQSNEASHKFSSFFILSFMGKIWHCYYPSSKH